MLPLLIVMKKIIESDSLSKPEGGGFFSLWKILIPIAIGIVAVGMMLWHDTADENIATVVRQIKVTPAMVIFIVMALLFMFCRDLGLSWRFRALTNRELSWKQAFRVDLLCEFTTCVTPSAVGGSAMGMVYLHTEGLELGRSTALMIATLFLDEFFFVVSCPLIALLCPPETLFASGDAQFSAGVRVTFWLVYAGLTLWTAILFCGIFVRPRAISRVLLRLFNMRWLRRWKDKIAAFGTDLESTSAELKSRPIRFWLEVFGGTALTWTSRFLVVCCLFMAFVPSTLPAQGIVLARQFVMWVVLMVTPTPGAAGLSEWVFSEYYGNIVGSAAMALLLAVAWRLICYYVYLFIGAVLVPQWVRRAFSGHGKATHVSTQSSIMSQKHR